MTSAPRKVKSPWLRQQSPLLVMALPALVLMLLFNYLPMAGIVIAFKDLDLAKGILGSPFVGFKNFKFLFGTADAWRITRNTLGMNMLFISVGLIVSVGFAIMLNEINSRKTLKFLQTTYFFPYFVSWVVAGYMFYAFFSMQYGILNGMLKSLGAKPIMWYNKTQYWPFILLFAYLWKNVGYYSVIYYASIMGIDHALYEAAMIDGASRWQQVTRITLPLLKPQIIVMVLLQVGKIFNSDFGLFYYVPNNSGPLYPVTDVIDTYVFRSFRVLGNVGMSTAAGFYQSCVGFTTIMITNLVLRKVSPENALF